MNGYGASGTHSSSASVKKYWTDIFGLTGKRLHEFWEFQWSCQRLRT